jgi:predicted RNA-binding protein with RPS1 domain
METNSTEDSFSEAAAGSFAAEFEKYVGEVLDNLSPGKIVTGKVVAVEREVVIVDISFKSYGVVPIVQFEDSDGKVTVKVGDQVDVYIVTLENDKNQVVLSRERAQQKKVWALGPILKDAVSRSRKKFIASVGPTWPIYSLLKNKFGEDVAFETMTYVALDPDYVQGLVERGYNETLDLLKAKGLNFKKISRTKNIIRNWQAKFGDILSRLPGRKKESV